VRLVLVAAVVALLLVCLTVLAALGVVDGNRVLDIMAAMVPAFAGGWLGAGVRNGNGRSGRPPPVALYPSERR
jgi:hypothetical protein